tara:strand:- start:146 stop:466 length:321 start_codon:yes stop_codon:yes gene_type:complete
MKKLTKLGETFRGAKGTYLLTKGHIDKYVLYLNEDYLQKNDEGEIHFTFKFIQAFQFKKDALKRMAEIEMEYLDSGENLAYLLNTGLISQEEYKKRLIEIKNNKSY